MTDGFFPKLCGLDDLIPTKRAIGEIQIDTPAAIAANELFGGQIPKPYEVDPLLCPKCQGEMKFISFINDSSAVDRIINHLNLSSIADNPPRPNISSDFPPAQVERSG